MFLFMISPLAVFLQAQQTFGRKNAFFCPAQGMGGVSGLSF
jgi:hypothetical protein